MPTIRANKVKLLSVAVLVPVLISCGSHPGRFATSEKEISGLKILKTGMLQRGESTTDCGPEALQLALSFYKVDVSLAEIAKQVVLPGQGTPSKAISPYLVHHVMKCDSERGSVGRIKEAVDAGHPVIVMVRLRAVPEVYHFLAIAGYSDRERVVVAPYYADRFWVIGWEELENIWKPAGFFMVEVSPFKDALEAARYWSRKHDFGFAIEMYTKALETEEKKEVIWKELGMCYASHEIDDHAKAVECYEKALAAMKDDIVLKNNLAYSFSRLRKDLDRAAALASEAVAAVSANLEKIKDATDDGSVKLAARYKQYLFYFNGTLAQVHAAAGRAQESMAAYDEALKYSGYIGKSDALKTADEAVSIAEKTSIPERAAHFKAIRIQISSRKQE